MKVILSLIGILLVSSLAHSQSGRRPKEIKVAVPPPAQEAPGADSAKPKPDANDRGTSVTAERGLDYRCSDDGTLQRVLDTGEIYDPTGAKERILTSKETDSRVVITSKPQPSYSREARRKLIQGFVTLKVLLSGNGMVSRVRVLKGLQAGLTESSIRAACKMKFRPALKDGEPVSQWVIAEYAFRISDSSIFRP